MSANKLFAKLASAQSEMNLGKDAHAQMGYSHDYVSEGAIMNAVRKHLAKAGVATFVSIYAHAQDGNKTVVEVLITFADSESGETFEVRGVGEGTDKADKATAKAITSAVRYALCKTLLQSGEIDPEQEYIEHVPGRTGIGDRASAPVADMGSTPTRSTKLRPKQTEKKRQEDWFAVYEDLFKQAGKKPSELTDWWAKHATDSESQHKTNIDRMTAKIAGNKNGDEMYEQLAAMGASEE